MEFAILNNDRSVKEIVRLIGYRAVRFNKAGGFSIVRRLGKNEYPRFHLIGRTQENEATLCNLHLDREKPFLRGVAGHGGEHEGRPVQEEMERIKDSLKKDLGVIHN